MAASSSFSLRLPLRSGSPRHFCRRQHAALRACCYSPDHDVSSGRTNSRRALSAVSVSGGGGGGGSTILVVRKRARIVRRSDSSRSGHRCGCTASSSSSAAAAAAANDGDGDDNGDDQKKQQQRGGGDSVNRRRIPSLSLTSPLVALTSLIFGFAAASVCFPPTTAMLAGGAAHAAATSSSKKSSEQTTRTTATWKFVDEAKKAAQDAEQKAIDAAAQLKQKTNQHVDTLRSAYLQGWAEGGAKGREVIIVAVVGWIAVAGTFVAIFRRLLRPVSMRSSYERQLANMEAEIDATNAQFQTASQENDASTNRLRTNWAKREAVETIKSSLPPTPVDDVQRGVAASRDDDDNKLDDRNEAVTAYAVASTSPELGVALTTVECVDVASSSWDQSDEKEKSKTPRNDVYDDDEATDDVNKESAAVTLPATVGAEEKNTVKNVTLPPPVVVVESDEVEDALVDALDALDDINLMVAAPSSRPSEFEERLMKKYANPNPASSARITTESPSSSDAGDDESATEKKPTANKLAEILDPHYSSFEKCVVAAGLLVASAFRTTNTK
ncbi:cyanobacterial aminoacyl-tRNA synthetase CAAD domain-containing protein [Pseudoscourfieldia marina]